MLNAVLYDRDSVTKFKQLKDTINNNYWGEEAFSTDFVDELSNTSLRLSWFLDLSWSRDCWEILSKELAQTVQSPTQKKLADKVGGKVDRTRSGWVIKNNGNYSNPNISCVVNILWANEGTTLIYSSSSEYDSENANWTTVARLGE